MRTHSDLLYGSGRDEGEDALARIIVGTARGGLEFDGADHVESGIDAADVGKSRHFDEACANAGIWAGRSTRAIDVISDYRVGRRRPIEDNSCAASDRA